MDRQGVTTDAAPPRVVAAIAPGTLIADRYLLEARLGAGGGGTVWRCLDQQLGAIVALKVVGADVDVERWRREVAMARRIADRNVCRVYDLGETAALRFVTMELVEGTGLRSRLGPNLAHADAMALFSQIVAGVAAIHAAGVVHRDLKPENIVVAHDGRVVIVDFGLAREPQGSATVPTRPNEAVAPTSEEVTIAGGGPITPTLPPAPRSPSNATVTQAGVVVGTPRYMSPEQAAGETVDARTDVWALGLIGHELFAGTLPALEPDGRPIARVLETTAPGVAAVLRRCLAFEPEGRFPDAGAVAAALAALSPRARRRWPLIGGGIAVAALVVGGVVAVVATRTRDDDHAMVAGPPRLLQVTTTDPRQWPSSSPRSVALSPDGSRFAYTTGDSRLWVRDLVGGAPVAWPTPKIDRDAAKPRELLISSWVVGWFSDRSVALLGATTQGDWELVRIYEDGRSRQLHRHPQRFAVAIAPDDRIAIGIDDYALFVMPPGERVTPDQIATIGHGERVISLAWSPDGKQLACGRLLPASAHDAAVQVMSATGSDAREVWRGRVDNSVEGLLGWLDDRRLVLAADDPAARAVALVTVDTTTGAAATRSVLAKDHVGSGSVARGTVLVLRGPARYSVQLGDRWGKELVPLHDPALEGTRLAGWTSSGEVVFALGPPDKLQLVRAKPGQAPVPWPGTTAGVESPDTVVGDSVIAHRVDSAVAQLVVERIGATGERVELVRLPAGPAGAVVRCAGDRAAPCVLEEVEGNTVRWTELDPTTGARGRVIHQRQVRERSARDVAVSPDGAQLAIVEGTSQVTVIDRATGTAERPAPAGDSTRLESLGYGPDGELWATATNFRGREFGLLSFKRTVDDQGPGSSHFLSGFPRGSREDTLRWYARPAPSSDGKRVALWVRELRLEIWRADGL